MSAWALSLPHNFLPGRLSIMLSPFYVMCVLLLFMLYCYARWQMQYELGGCEVQLRGGSACWSKDVVCFVSLASRRLNKQENCN